MSCRIGMVLLVIVSGLLLTACESMQSKGMAGKEGWNHYGLNPDFAGQTVSLGALRSEKANIVVEGTVKEVCVTAGCWATIVDEAGHELFVRTKNESFFLPRDCVGRQAVAHGEAKVVEYSVEQLRHFAKDGGATEAELAAITKPQRKVMLVADSIYIEGKRLGKAYSPKEAAEACGAAHEEEK